MTVPRQARGARRPRMRRWIQGGRTQALIPLDRKGTMLQPRRRVVCTFCVLCSLRWRRRTAMNTRAGGPMVAAALVVAAAGVLAQGRQLRPVTDDMLLNPSTSDWLHWRRTYDGWGYSPLNQINRQNVGQLQLAWSWAMRDGNQQTTPLVHDGVMYLANPGSVVQALDAATGDLLWEYQHEFSADRRDAKAIRAIRGLSIYDDKIFLNTADAHLVALDARTGRVVWNVQVSDPKNQYFYSAPALVVRGKVVSGLQGCEQFHEEK